MRLIHTSDWHLGRTLYGRKRYHEHGAFLDWLIATLHRQIADVLVIAGDIFDSTAPSNRAQELYYRFLCRAAAVCRHVVVIAGNHDSPSFLNAPRELLKTMNVHVVGIAATQPEDEIFILSDRNGLPAMIVCAVPYLRDRDMRTVEAGESVADKQQKLLDGIREHYHAVSTAAVRKRNELGGAIPIVALGHLFTAGGQTVTGDGVRELYVGSLAHVCADIFSAAIDYLALGHLHVPQMVNGSNNRRYSGSPLAIGFGEASQRKSVCQVDFDGREATVELLEIPVFQKLEQVRGDWPTIEGHLMQLAQSGAPVWVEVIYDGADPAGNLRERIDTLCADTALDILRIKNQRVVEQVLSPSHHKQTLDDLDAMEVFERCLDAHGINEDQRPGLRDAYREILLSLVEEDKRAD